MTTLHLVNQAPSRSDTLAACLAVIAAGDGLLLIEDGVYAAVRDGLGACPDGVELMVLIPDAAARGVAEHVDPGCAPIDHAGFVAACTRHDRVVSWR